MKDILKLGLTLAVFAVVSCVSLALVNSLTAPVIAERKMSGSAAAMRQVFAEAAKFEPVEAVASGESSEVKLHSVNLAKSADGALLGAVVEAEGPTYDKAVILVGVDTSFAVKGTVILELYDSPGFGQRAKEGGYMDQYNGKTTGDAFVVGEDIVAISGASISSKGIAAIVKAAAKEAEAVIKENSK
ncbi:MAG: FMN-binding protein [Spirochaetaceae bacterium]|nr:FMN-binding protein [Spirochaetaceae bacterium]MBO7420522.1 FMN-binding protein [Spirochaetaceae bacterium]